MLKIWGKGNSVNGTHTKRTVIKTLGTLRAGTFSARGWLDSVGGKKSMKKGSYRI